MKRLHFAIGCLVTLAYAPCMAFTLTDAPKESLQKLQQGNARYVSAKELHPNRSQESRHAVASSQRPFAAILGCSDSRVAPEILFDQGIGDLFIVRVAGNVAGPVELDSLEYAVDVLGASVVVVLGHEGCGAIKAVLDGNTAGIPAVAQLLEPPVNASRGKPGDAWENAIRANIKSTVRALRQTSVLAPVIRAQKLEIVGAYYHLKSGEVEFIRE